MTEPESALRQSHREDRRQHLALIQGVINRMHAASSTAKGWLLPVVTATYGYALTQSEPSVAVLGVAAVALFCFLDANYLRQEQAYRCLYKAVAEQSESLPPFTLRPGDACGPSTAQNRTWLTKLCRWIGKWLPGPRVWASWSIAPFYGCLILVGLYIACSR